MSDLKEFQTGAGGDPFNGAVNGTVGATTPNTAVVTTLTANTSVSTDLVNEKTSGSGVTVDGVLIKDNAVSASSGFTQSNTFSSASTMGFKNRIINGAMMIDQRNAGASVTGSGSSTQYSLDRWNIGNTVASKFTAQQSTTVPAGFKNSLLFTSSSAYSVGSTDFFMIRQLIEGFNVADLNWGSANAQTITISFWTRCSLTGTFGGALTNAAYNRSYPFTYTISAANTWEQKTVTIVGDTSGTWATDNTAGIQLIFSMGTGSTNSGTAGSWSGSNYYSATGATSVVGTNGATFYITGVQLEKGSTATSFDYRPYGTELALCQRYFQTYTQPPLRGAVSGVGTQALRMGMILPVIMRANPTTTVGALPVFDGSNTTTVTSIAVNYSTTKTAEFDFNLAATLNLVRPCIVYQDGSTTMTLSAEL
jgi:hypothetical protein